MSIEPRKKDRKPLLPYFTPIGWLALGAIAAAGFAIGVALAQWVWTL